MPVRLLPMSEGDSVKLVVAAASVNRIVLEVVATCRLMLGTSGGTAWDM
jgi:hypothetical protein